MTGKVSRRSFGQPIIGFAGIPLCDSVIAQGTRKSEPLLESGFDREQGESAEDFSRRVGKSGIVESPESERALLAFDKAYSRSILGIQRTNYQVFLKMQDGAGVAWLPLEDGLRDKAFEERLASPDLTETLHDKYPAALSFDKWPENLDPGRYRVDEFFKTVYGKDASQVSKNLVSVQFAGTTLKFNQNNGAAESLSRVGVKMAAIVKENPAYRKYLEQIGWTFTWRNISGTNRLSAHSFGVTVDLNPALGGYWKWGSGKDLPDMERRLRYPPEIVAAFESENFIWGGKWYHYDLMHFEYRPELFSY